MNDKPCMLPPRRAAAELGISEHAVRRWLADGTIKGVKIGSKTLINVGLLKEKLNTI